MNARQFANALRIMWNIDQDDVPFLTTGQWMQFRDNPPAFFMRASEENQQKLWAVIEARQPKESAT